MIVTERLAINGKHFAKTYSDAGYMVERDGVRYSEAIDPAEFGRVYMETDERIDSDYPALTAKDLEDIQDALNVEQNR